jgi:alpha-galactosidase
MSRILIAAIFIGLLSLAAHAGAPATQPSYWAFAPTPPMGWNSYDTFGDSVTEAEVLANAEFMKDHLVSHGWKYIVVDFRWYDPGADSGDPNSRAGAQLTADQFGRLTPAVNRFPSAAGGAGFGPLAAKIHAMGLKFGIHVMRGIPRQSVRDDLPIEDSTFHATDAANKQNICLWCADMFGVHGATPAGQAWYDSIVRLYAQWGVDYIKVDDLSFPYSADEVAALRTAIDKCGRPIVLSLSPGETPVADAEHVSTHANLWRISGDFWDRWRSLNRQFDLIARWKGVAGPGRWPDADMIPLGHIAIRCNAGGKGDRWTRFTKDEQVTLMSMWALAPSPLMLGMNMPDNDEWTNSLLTNDAVLAVNQDALGAPGVLVSPRGMQEVWKKPLADGTLAVGLFNRASDPRPVSVTWKDLGISTVKSVSDLWAGKDVAISGDGLTLDLPPHGSELVHVEPGP